jgi:hypothetical protein
MVVTNVDSLSSNGEKQSITTGDSLNLPLFPPMVSSNVTNPVRSQKTKKFTSADEVSDLSGAIDSSISPVGIVPQSTNRSVAELTDIVIRSNFDSDILGKCFLECVAGEQAIENAIAFSAIIGKAIDVRQKKNQSK